MRILRRVLPRGVSFDMPCSGCWTQSLIRHRATPLSAVIAGLCIGASFLTKQIAVFMVAPIMLHAFFVNRRYALWLWITIAVIVIGSTVVLMAATGGWYRFYTYDLLRSEGTFQEMYSAFWWFDIGFRVQFGQLRSV